MKVARCLEGTRTFTHTLHRQRKFFDPSRVFLRRLAPRPGASRRATEQLGRRHRRLAGINAVQVFLSCRAQGQADIRRNGAWGNYSMSCFFYKKMQWLTEQALYPLFFPFYFCMCRRGCTHRHLGAADHVSRRIVLFYRSFIRGFCVFLVQARHASLTNNKIILIDILLSFQIASYFGFSR